MFVLYRKSIGNSYPLVVTDDFQIAKDELFRIISSDVISRLGRGDLIDVVGISSETIDDQVIAKTKQLVEEQDTLYDHYRVNVRLDKEYEVFLVDRQEWLTIEQHEQLKVIKGEDRPTS